MPVYVYCLFFGSLVLLLYAYFGYPWWIARLARTKGKPVEKSDITPTVAVVIAVHNGAEWVGEKIKDLRAQDYPKQIKIYIGLDACTDDSAAIIAKFPSVACYDYSERSGKSAVLNKIMENVKEEIVVFADVRQRFDNDAISQLVANFADESVGVVSGDYYMVDDDSGMMHAVGVYWQMEKNLRRNEALYYSTVGATGSIYAIRRDLYINIPTDALIDDVSIPLKINAQGYRTVFDTTARAYDSFSDDWEHEWQRKIRTMTGNYQIALQPSQYGNPYQSKLRLQYVSHKLLRLLIPALLATVLISCNMLKGQSWFFVVFLLLQLACYSLASISIISGDALKRFKIFNIPGTFMLMNLAVLAGAYFYITNKYKRGW